MAQRFEVAENRLFKNVFICRKCGARIRAKNITHARCRTCKNSAVRLKNKEPKG